MATVSATGPASIDEIAAEMDRRGAVIQKLEGEIQRLSLNRVFERGSEDGNRAIMKRRLDDLRENQSDLIAAGKHLAVKLADVYRAARVEPKDCQAIRDWIAALAKAERRS